MRDRAAEDAMNQALVEALAVQAARVTDAYAAGDPDADRHRNALMARIFALDERAARLALGTVLFMLASEDEA